MSFGDACMHTGVSRIEPYFGMSSMGESSMGGYGVSHGHGASYSRTTGVTLYARTEPMYEAG